MKDFMFFFRGPADLKLSPEQTQTQMKKWFDWINELTDKGHYVTGSPMAKEAKTIRGLKPVATDGPFTEGKEVLGGYLLIKAASLEQATELAYGFPDYDKNCSLEVRELTPVPAH